MTTSFRISDGDLVLSGSELAVVSGLAKLSQDIQLWVKEIYQNDRFHPAFGSTLEGFVGQIIDEDSAFYIENEIRRVLENYQTAQLRGVQRNPDVYSDDELLDTINSVTATLDFDKVYVSVKVTTVAGSVLSQKIGVV